MFEQLTGSRLGPWRMRDENTAIPWRQVFVRTSLVWVRPISLTEFGSVVPTWALVRDSRSLPCSCLCTRVVERLARLQPDRGGGLAEPTVDVHCNLHRPWQYVDEICGVPGRDNCVVEDGIKWVKSTEFALSMAPGVSLPSINRWWYADIPPARAFVERSQLAAA